MTSQPTCTCIDYLRDILDAAESAQKFVCGCELLDNRLSVNTVSAE